MSTALCLGENMNIKSVNMIEVNDWDKLVVETYGRPYNFQQQDDCKDRGIYKFSVPVEYPEDFENNKVPEKTNHSEMGVSFKAWLERDPKQGLSLEDGEDRNNQWYIDLWWERNFYPHIDVVINDLHSKGLLEAGEYMINIDW